jgi:hypothetical protein
MKGASVHEGPSDERGGGSPVSNYFGSSTWAAACPRTTVLSPRDVTSLGYDASLLGRVRPDGVEKRVEQHVFAKFAAARSNAQVKDTDIRMSLGPPPWRPPE